RGVPSIGLLGFVCLGGTIVASFCVRSWLSVSPINAEATAGGRADETHSPIPRQTDWPWWPAITANASSTTAIPPQVGMRAANIEWEGPLPGSGHSSPIVWDDNVFVTTAEESPQSQSILCIDIHDGHVRWNAPVLHGLLPLKHEKNSHASATPVCDGD